jgi:hypothetical protein
MLIATAMVARRLPWFAWVSVAVVFAGLALEVVGNVRVANAIWRTSFGDEEAGEVGPTYPGFESGHEIAEAGDLLVVLGGLALALCLGLSQHVSKAAAWTGGVLSLFPPWMYPALGTLVLLIWLFAAHPYRADVEVEEAEPAGWNF